MKNDDVYKISYSVLRKARAHAIGNIPLAIENLKNEAINSEYISCLSKWELQNAGAVLKGLNLFGKSGNYMDLLQQNPCSTTLVDDYLASIKKCHYGFNSWHNNIDAAQNLRDKVGPKNFEKRLTSFLKRKIDKMVKWK